jgi:hypothetical protein
MNREFLISIALAFGFLNLVATSSFARLLEVWPYERFVAESDLVALVEPIENRAVSDLFVDVPKQSAADFAAIDTRFKVQATLKGDTRNLKELTVLHFNYAREATMVNGPMFIRFPIEEHTHPTVFGPPQRNQGKIYLAFLKHRKDGRFEPVRGQYDSVLSFREIREIWDVDLGK